jgi:NADPH:quinone reductase-like Zn-dependent oxidoreductase
MPDRAPLKWTADQIPDLTGRHVLITRANSGIGLEIAVARGVTVTGTASEGNHEFLRSLGAIPTTYGPGLADRVRALAPAGVDTVLDVAGAGSLPDLVKIAPSTADVVSIADPTAQEHGARLSTAPDDPTPASLVEAAALGAAGSYVPYVDASFALDQIAEAHARSQAGHARGKLVIRLGPPRRPAPSAGTAGPRTAARVEVRPVTRGWRVFAADYDPTSGTATFKFYEDRDNFGGTPV